MVIPAVAMALAASDMNDSSRTAYTDDALLPYFNMAVEEMFQRMQESNIPITNKTSTHILVPPLMTEITFTSVPALPAGLVDIEEIWESNDGISWGPMSRTGKISPNIATNANLALFSVFEWLGDRIKVPQSRNAIQLEIDYIRRNVTIPLLIGQINTPIDSDAILFLAHKTAALCAALVAQDETRAAALNDLAEQAIERELNIPTKGRQQIATRRRPFRAAYKTRGIVW